MSTRAQVILEDDNGGTLWFYRHSDGYPEGVKKTLDRFCQWINEGRIRANVEQAAGWLVLLGAAEYDKQYINHKWKRKTRKQMFEPIGEDSSGMGWKAGAYEPSVPELHGDIEHLYVVTLKSANRCTGKALWQEVQFDHKRTKLIQPWRPV